MTSLPKSFYRVVFRLNDTTSSKWRIARVGIPASDMAWEAANAIRAALLQLEYNTAETRAEIDSDNVPAGSDEARITDA